MEVLKAHLVASCTSGMLREVEDILRDYPGIDVNAGADNHESGTALYLAVSSPSIVSALLAHPAIDVNTGRFDEMTPLMHACSHNPSVGITETVTLLLRDPRVDPMLCDAGGRTALWWACSSNNIDAVKAMFISGRDLNYAERGMSPTGEKCNAFDIAVRHDHTDMWKLLKRFSGNPEGTRRALVNQSPLAKADNTFATMWFLSEGFFRLTDPEEERKRGRRNIRNVLARSFFNITTRLTPEMQMIVANRVYGAGHRDVIPESRHRPARVELERRLKTVEHPIQAFLDLCRRHRSLREVAEKGHLGTSTPWYEFPTVRVWFFDISFTSASSGTKTLLHVMYIVEEIQSVISLLFRPHMPDIGQSQKLAAVTLYFGYHAELNITDYRKNRPSDLVDEGHPLYSGKSTIRTLHMITEAIGLYAVRLIDQSTVSPYTTPFSFLRWSVGLPSFYEGLGYAPVYREQERLIEEMKELIQVEPYTGMGIQVLARVPRSDEGNVTWGLQVDETFMTFILKYESTLHGIMWERQATDRDIDDWLQTYSS